MSLNKQQSLNEIDGDTSNLSADTTTDQLNFDLIKNAKLKLKLKQIFQPNVQTQYLTNQTSFDRYRFKSISPFSGKIGDFLDFFEMFLYAVHDTNLDKSIKLMFLKKNVNSQIINLECYSSEQYVKALQEVFVRFTHFEEIVNEIVKFSVNIRNSHTIQQFETILFKQLGPIAKLSGQYEIGIGLEILIFSRFSKKVPLCITEEYMSTLENNLPFLHSYFVFIVSKLSSLDDEIFVRKNNSFKTQLNNEKQLETVKKYTELLEIINCVQNRANCLPKLSKNNDVKKRIEHLEKIVQELRYVNNIFINNNLGKGFEFFIVKKCLSCVPKESFKDFIRSISKRKNQTSLLSQLLFVLESNVISEKNIQRWLS